MPLLHGQTREGGKRPIKTRVRGTAAQGFGNGNHFQLLLLLLTLVVAAYFHCLFHFLPLDYKTSPLLMWASIKGHAWNFSFQRFINRVCKQGFASPYNQYQRMDIVVAVVIIAVALLTTTSTKPQTQLAQVSQRHWRMKVNRRSSGGWRQILLLSTLLLLCCTIATTAVGFGSCHLVEVETVTRRLIDM